MPNLEVESSLSLSAENSAFGRWSLAVALVFVLNLIVPSTKACDGFWNLDPVDDSWNNPANWSENCVPNGLNDVALFAASNLPEIEISEGATVFAMQFQAGASSYTFIAPPSKMLTLAQSGVVNQSGVLQQFVATVDEAGNVGVITLLLQSTAGVLTTFTAEGSLISGGNGAFIQFQGVSDGGSTTVSNNGGRVSEGKGGETDFFNSASGGSAIIINRAGEVGGALGGMTQFWMASRGTTSVITCEGASISGATGGLTLFRDTSTANNATLIANSGSNGAGGGSIQFQGSAAGGTPRIELFGNGNLDLTLRDSGTVTIGSLEGDGQVLLGSHKLNIGANNLSTTFAGVIQNDGAISKTGTGTLTLSGANLYTDGTTVTSGAVKVANRTGSATGTGAVTVNAGILGGRGTIAGATTIGTGSSAGAFLEPSVGARQPVTTTIQSLLTFKADGSYTYKLDSKQARADEVVANGVTIESGAQFNFTAIGNKRLPLGSVFLAISNTSAGPISGTFANLADGSTFSAGKNKYQASYTGGDGNDLTLTVVP